MKWIKALFIIACFICYTLLLFIPLLITSWFKFVPHKKTQSTASQLVAAIAEFWCSCNNFLIAIFNRDNINIHMTGDVNRHDSYLIISNHLSWVDIPLLQYALNKKIPPFKFFIKQELIFVPLLGYAWWALDFPFMKRYSKAYLAKHPEKKGTDIEQTKRACAKFSRMPVSIINYAEGTRFTPEKAQNSDYKHLLNPRSGGIIQALSMITAINQIMNVTVIYPRGTVGVIDFLAGEIDRLDVYIEVSERPEWLGRGDYHTDTDYKTQTNHWINTLWQEKDHVIHTVLADKS